MHRREGKFINKHDLDMVGYNSDFIKQNQEIITDVDLVMRANYAALKSAVILRLTPVIIVNNDPYGGTYTLVFEGTRKTVRPISKLFELVKSISHVPLGIYSVIAPYLKKRDSPGWVAGLRQFRGVLQDALDAVQDAGLPRENEITWRRILIGGLDFIDTSTAAGAFTIESWRGDGS